MQSNEISPAAIDSSLALWPDPFDAPGCPPPSIVSHLLDHPEADPDLLAQLHSTPEGIRAISALRTASTLAPAPLPTPAPLSPIRSLFPTPSPSFPVSFGEIWMTHPIVAFFDGSSLVPRKTWLPPIALIVAEPQDTGCDTICRALPCSSTELCPLPVLSSTPTFRFPDENGTEYAAHLDLEHPVSTSQLARKIGTLHPAHLAPFQEALCANLQAIPHPRLPSPSEKPLPHATLTAYLRIADCASWLSATASAKLQASLHSPSLTPSIPFPPAIRSRFEQSPPHPEELALAAASSLLPPTRAIFLAAGSEDSHPDFPLSAPAHITEPASVSDGSPQGQWELSPSLAISLPDGTEFFLFHKKTGDILGAGNASGGRFLELRDASHNLLANALPSDYAIVVSVP